MLSVNKKNSSKKPLIRDSCGIGLVSVMVAAGIGLIVTLGIVSLITDVFKSQKTVRAKDEKRDLSVGIRSLLMDPDACSKSFEGKGPITSSSVISNDNLKNKDGDVEYSKGKNTKFELLEIENFELRNYNPLLKRMDLDIKVKAVDPTLIGGSTFLPYKILLDVTLDTSLKIFRCHALGSADSLWQLVEDLTSIYFSSGNVGIGTATPVSKLEVAGGHIFPSKKETMGSECKQDGLMAIDENGRLLSCQKNLSPPPASIWREQVPSSDEEVGAIIGCNLCNDYCASEDQNKNGCTGQSISSDVEIYKDVHYLRPAYKVTIGGRTFCALGFYSVGPLGSNLGGGFCRVTKSLTEIDPVTNRPIWYLLLGTADGKSEVSCHVVCIK